MDPKRSNVKRVLKAGGVCYGTMLRILRSPQALALTASQGWDYIILDTEHNDYNMETLANMAFVAKYEELGFFVRVPDKLYHQMAQMLDVGAEGLVLPQVKTPAEAAHIIQSVKYAPLGKRGVSVSEAVTRFRPFDVVEYARYANDENMTIVQIESQEGVDNVRDIVATPGIDAVMIGPSDLTMDMGIPGQFHHPTVEASFRKVIDACNEFGVAPGIHLSNMDDVKKWVREGMRFVTYSYDIQFFKNALRDAVLELRGRKM